VETTLTIQPGEVATVDTTEGVKIDLRNDGEHPVTIRLVNGKLPTTGVAEKLGEGYLPWMRPGSLEYRGHVFTLTGFSARRHKGADDGNVRRDGS
jgi:hypothetical protein